MSFLRWLFGSTPRPTSSGVSFPHDSAGLSRQDATRPIGRGYMGKRKATAPEPAAQPEMDVAPEGETSAMRRELRAMRRELLFGVVRESMVRAGVLSASYKFKVLSLDTRGHHFLIMMDLSSEFTSDAHRLTEIEALVAQRAKARYDIDVKALYWRAFDHVATGDLLRSGHAREAAQAASLDAMVSAGSAHAAVAASLPASFPAAVSPTKALPVREVRRPVLPPAPQYEPIGSDEVNAFRAALDAGLPPPRPPVEPGFEDTEAVDYERDDRHPGLSNTQYGDL
jgi:hypothetical protein